MLANAAKQMLHARRNRALVAIEAHRKGLRECHLFLPLRTVFIGLFQAQNFLQRKELPERHVSVQRRSRAACVSPDWLAAV